MKQNFNKGFGIVEIIVGAAIISFAFFGLMNTANLSLKVLHENSRDLKAVFLLEEGAESVKILRDEDWNNIAALVIGTDYYLEFDGEIWNSTTTNVFIDDFFEKKFIFEDVYRDSNDDISVSGTLDPNTKKTAVSVSWRGRNGTTTKSVSFFISNIFE